MNIFGLYVISLAFTTCSLCSVSDLWKGEEYAKNSSSQKSSAEDFLQSVTFTGSEIILDVGCGDGKVTALLASHVPLGSVIGVDISPSMIATAENTYVTYPNLRFYTQDAAQIQFPFQFDLITSFTVMQWVLEQEQALSGFYNTLKPGGKLWIQMPTGLPHNMEIALDHALNNPLWKEYFVGFSAPWKFYQPHEYKQLLLNAHFIPTRIEVVTKHECFPSRAAFHHFLKQWFPYLRPLPTEKQEAFLTYLLDEYLKLVPIHYTGSVSFTVDRLEVEAIK